MKKSVLLFLLTCSVIFTLKADHDIYFYPPSYNMDSCSAQELSFDNQTLLDSFYYNGDVIFKWTVFTANNIIEHRETTYDTATDFVYTFESGHYRIELLALDSTGKPLSNTYQNPYHELLSLTGAKIISSGGDNICPGETVTLSADIVTMNSLYNHIWTINGEEYYDNNVEYTFNEEKIHNITLSLPDHECIDNTFEKQINVTSNAKPNPIIHINGKPIVCPNDELPLKPSVINHHSTYEWSIDGAYHDGVPKTSISFTDTGVHNVVLTEVNSCNIVGSDTLLIGVSDSAKINIYDVGIHVDEWKCDTAMLYLKTNTTGNVFYWSISNFSDTILDTTTISITGPHPFLENELIDYKLKVNNSCGITDSVEMLQESVPANPLSTQIPDIYFDLVNREYQNSGESIDLTVCKNSSLTFQLEDTKESYLDYFWIIDNGTTIDTIPDDNGTLTYTFSNTNFHYISAYVEDPCNPGSGITSMTYANIDVKSSMPPMADLQVFPTLICPGDRVYFWDEEFDNDDNYQPNEYSIYFGDGTKMENFAFSTVEVGALAAHLYDTTGIYNAMFVVKDVVCGSSDTIKGNIKVSDTINKKDKYFVTNNTYKEQSPQIMKNWSNKPSHGNYLHVKVPVYWMDWQPGMDTNFILTFFDKKRIGPDGPQGPPQGYSIFNSNTINMDDTANAYITSDFLNDTLVYGFGYFCDNKYLFDDNLGDKEPNVYVSAGAFKLKDTGTIMLPMIDVSMHYTNPMDTISICDSRHISKTKGFWYDSSNSKLNIWEESGTFYYDISSPDFYSEGDITISNLSNDTTYIELYSMYGDCFSGSTPAAFYFSDSTTINFIRVDTISYPNYCNKLWNLISDNKFTEGPSLDNMKPVCPNETVDFEVFGAKDVIWNFGGNIQKTGNKVSYTFKTPGFKDVLAFVTNRCGYKDTLKTQVAVTNNLTPNAYFSYNEIMSGLPNTYELTAEEYMYNDDNANDNKYTWTFGNGDTVIGPHITYTFSDVMNGTYMPVTLTVTNGCGSASESQDLMMNNDLYSCAHISNLDFQFMPDIANNDWLTYDFKTLTPVQGDITYFFNYGDGNIDYFNDTSQVMRHTYHEEGEYIITHGIIDHDSSCTFKVSDNPYFFGNPSCDADFDIYFVDDSTRRFVDITQGTNTAVWSFGDGSTKKGKDITHTFMKKGVNEVCLSSYDTVTEKLCNLCKPVTIGNDAKTCYADFTYTVDSLTINFQSDAIAEGHIEYWWEFGNNTSSNMPNPSVTYQREGEYEVCLNIMNDSGCVATTCQFVKTERTSCAADFEYFVDANTRKVTFTNKSSGSVSDYYWEFGDGKYAEKMDTSHTYQKAGEYQVCLNIYSDTSNCQAQKCKTIMIPEDDNQSMLSADFGYMPLPSDKKTIVFSDKSLGMAKNYYWTFGDGSYNQGTDTLTHSYSMPGVYDVCLVIDDFDGTNADSVTTSKKCKKVNVGLDSMTCVLDADFNYFIKQDSNKISVSDQSNGEVTSWYWNFGDGATSTNANAKHVYSQPGFYLVSLSVRNSVGGCSDYIAKFIQIGKADCKAKFNYSVIPDSNKVSFIDKSEGNIANRLWLFNDGAYSLNEKPVHKYRRPGVYDVALSINDASGTCMDITNQEVQVGKIDCNADFDVYVEQDSNKVYLTNKILGNSTSKYWVFGDGATSTGDNPVHTFTQPGYYTISLNTYDNNTGCMDYHEEKVLISSIGQDCEADFFFITNGYEIKTLNKSVPKTGLTYTWDMGDGSIYNTENAIHTYNSTDNKGIYNVCLIAKASANIEDITCKRVKIDPDASNNCETDFIFNITDDLNNTVQFVDKSYGNPDSWSWKFGDGTTSTQQNPSHNFSKDSIYIVRLETENITSGCKNTGYALVNLTAGSNIQAGFGYDELPSNKKTTGYPVDFVAITHGDAAKLKWSFGDGEYDSTNTNPTHEYDTAGEYTACLQIWDPITGETDEYCELVKVGQGSNIKNISAETFTTLTNYPNPFKEITHIVFTLNYKTIVNLAVYNTEGELIKTIINTVKTAGDHRIIWNGGQLKTGVYYLQLMTNEGIQTKKMIKE